MARIASNATPAAGRGSGADLSPGSSGLARLPRHIHGTVAARHVAPRRLEAWWRLRRAEEMLFNLLVLMLSRRGRVLMAHPPVEQHSTAAFLMERVHAYLAPHAGASDRSFCSALLAADWHTWALGRDPARRDRHRLRPHMPYLEVFPACCVERGLLHRSRLPSGVSPDELVARWGPSAADSRWCLLVCEVGRATPVLGRAHYGTEGHAPEVLAGAYAGSRAGLGGRRLGRPSTLGAGHRYLVRRWTVVLTSHVHLWHVRWCRWDELG